MTVGVEDYNQRIFCYAQDDKLVGEFLDCYTRALENLGLQDGWDFGKV